VRRAAILLGFLGPWLGGWTPFQSKNPDVEEGNRRLAEGKLDEAEQAYRRAEKAVGEAFGLRYNLGTLFHERAAAEEDVAQRNALRDSAEKEYRRASESPEAGLKSRAHYNLGNLEMDRGLDEQAPEQASQRFRAAVDEYKKSLRLDPHNEDARRNLELALRYAQKPPPPKQQQQQQQQQDQGKPQPKPDQQKPDQQPQDGQDQQKPKPDEPKPDEGQKPDQQKPEDGDQAPQPRPDEKPSDRKEPPQPDKGTNEIEERKLDALERRSKDLQISRQKVRMPETRRGRPEKDW
jgi:Ca-activated chloride channel family protein